MDSEGEKLVRGGSSDKKPGFFDPCVRILQNRWVRLVIFTLTCFTTTAVYYGWQQYQLMLYDSGAYSWLCREDELDEDGLCKAQVDAVAILYSIAAGCEYASAALGGALHDQFGPRRIGLLGESMFGLGTLMLAFSTHKVPLYIPAMIVIGTSVNITSFPSLCTVEIFPEWHGLMVGLMLAASQASSGITPILYALMQKHPSWTFRGTWIGYWVCVCLPISILYVIALPGSRNFDKVLELQRQQMIEDELCPEPNENEPPTQPDEGAVVRSQSDQEEAPLKKSASRASQHAAAGKASWGDFFRSVRTIDMAVMALCFFMLNVCYAYYPTVVRRAISTEVSDFLAYAMPSQAVWALLTGLICDYCSTVTVMTVISSLLGIIYIFCLVPHIRWLQYTGAVILVLSQSAVFEIKFTYVKEMFDPFNYGKLVGLLGVVGGLGTFVNIGMSGVANYQRVFIAYICVVAGELLLVGYLAYRQRVLKVCYKTLPESAQDKSTPCASPETV